MLTEVEILDGQTQTLEEAMDKLTDREVDTVEPNKVDDVGISGILEIAVESLRATVDLHRTIAQEGVSLADVQALRAIQARMAPIARLPTKVALESYEGMFTPQRSMINQTVSQEAALAEIGKTLKEWFFIFVDFIIRIVDWCRRVWNSEDFIRGRLKLIDLNLQTMYNQLMDLVAYSTKLGRDPVSDLLLMGETVLNDPKLTHSKSMLVAFNISKNAQAIANTDKQIDRAFLTLHKSAASLKSHIENNKPMIVSENAGVEINDMAKLLEELTVAVDDKDFLVDNIRRDFWLTPTVLTKRPIFAAGHNIEQVQKLAKELRGIKRNANFDDLKDTYILVNSVESLTEGLKGLERIIKFKQQLYADYYKASATYANFYIRARAHLEESLKTHAADDLDRLVLERLAKLWDALLERMGL